MLLTEAICSNKLLGVSCFFGGFLKISKSSWSGRLKKKKKEKTQNPRKSGLSSGNDLKKKKTEPQVSIPPFQTQTFRPLIRVFKIKRRLRSSTLNIFHSSEKSGDLQSAYCFRNQFSQLHFSIFFVSKLVHFKRWLGSGHMVKKTPPTLQETWVWSLGWEDPLEKGMATHSSTLAWRVPWTEEPGRLQSMGSHRVGHDWSDLALRNWHTVEVLQDLFYEQTVCELTNLKFPLIAPGSSPDYYCFIQLGALLAAQW